MTELHRKIDSIVEDYHDHISDCKLTNDSSQERINIYLHKLNELLENLLPAYEVVIVRYPEMKNTLDDLKVLKQVYFLSLQNSFIKDRTEERE